MDWIQIHSTFKIYILAYTVSDKLSLTAGYGNFYWL
jgi:hypothetical protein